MGYFRPRGNGVQKRCPGWLRPLSKNPYPEGLPRTKGGRFGKSLELFGIRGQKSFGVWEQDQPLLGEQGGSLKLLKQGQRRRCGIKNRYLSPGEGAKELLLQSTAGAL